MKRLKGIILMGLCLVGGLGVVGCGSTSESFKDEKIKVGKYEVDGILTLPKDVEKAPGVILVQGSGQSDMDETINENKPFKDIAEGLAKEGVASIKYNKRYFQYPEKASADLTVEQEVIDDVHSAIELAVNTKKIDGDRIYIAGHSLGGMLAPKIATDNKDVKGFISLAGSPRYLYEISLSQNKMLIDKMDISKEEKEKLLNSAKVELDKIKNLKDEEGSTLNVGNDYWRSLNAIDTRKIASKLDKPILILQGESDFQVNMEDDFKEWQKVLKDNNSAEFKSYPNLNHLFMTSNGKNDITEYDEKGRVDESVIKDIATFVKK